MLSPTIHQVCPYFNPLPPHGGRLQSRAKRGATPVNFNPLPPHGVRRTSLLLPLTALLFQSTPSTRRETFQVRQRGGLHPFQSTPSPRRETTKESFAAWESVISIHSLHTEGDFQAVTTRGGTKHFNPLPPHGGRRLLSLGMILLSLFQSTPSTRRETELKKLSNGSPGNFNPLPPHGGRRHYV